MTTKYTSDHEWARQEGDVIVVGITDYAQGQLGELVYVELPSVDQEVGKGDEAAVIESVKAAGEVKSPVGGVITEINEALSDSPEKINEDPAGEGWVYKVKPSDPAEFDSLMSEDDYQSLVDSLS